MPKFVYVYHAPAPPPDAPQPSPEQMAEVMEAWNQWAGGLGDRLLDFGTPLAEGVRVTADGTSASDRDVTGYSIIEADDLDAAVALAADHPHLQMPGGCEIEVHEAQAVPGM
ncbi:MAG TPA: YciI family protein [Nitriliruptoraceae bacterium]|nr:YciI family protein [Nitriliruptoraceae bacterium]